MSSEERIAELESALNRSAGKWARADAELHANDGTLWHELFGTPERAARTLTEYFIEGCDGVACADECPFYDSTSYMDCRVAECNNDALLEWLRGKAVS